MKNSRDSQRQRVYDAETYSFSDGVHRPSRAGGKPNAGDRVLDPMPSGEERTDEEIQKLVNKIFKSSYVQRKWGRETYIGGEGFPTRRSMDFTAWRYIPTVRTSHANANHAWACHSKREIAFPAGEWHRRKSIIIHECAHHIAYQKYGDVGHGWQFAMIFLDLVRHFMGKEAHTKLKEAFKTKGVRFKPKQVRNYTPEQREAMRQRMMVARAARKVYA